MTSPSLPLPSSCSSISSFPGPQRWPLSRVWQGQGAALCTRSGGILPEPRPPSSPFSLRTGTAPAVDWIGGCFMRALGTDMVAASGGRAEPSRAVPLTTAPRALARNRNRCRFRRDRDRAGAGSDVRPGVAAEGTGTRTLTRALPRCLRFGPARGAPDPRAGWQGESPVVSASAFGRELFCSLPHTPSTARQGEAPAERPSDGGGTGQRRDKALLLARAATRLAPPAVSERRWDSAGPAVPAAAHPLGQGVFRAGLDLSRPLLEHQGHP